jgi:hypothetical protein
MKKSGKLACHVVNWNIAIWKDLCWWADSCRHLKYRGGCTIPLFQIILYDVKSVSNPGTIALLGNNYSLQIIETGFAEQFYVSHRMGPASICLKISASTDRSKTYWKIPPTTRLISHWSIPLSNKWEKYLSCFSPFAYIIESIPRISLIGMTEAPDAANKHNI